MAALNAKEAVRQTHDKAEKLERTLLEMPETLELSTLPHKIACFDRSKLGGSAPVASNGTCTAGKKAK